MVLSHTPLPRKVNWPTKKSLTVSVWRQYPKMKGFCLQAIVYILKQRQYIVSLIVRIVQEWEWEWILSPLHLITLLQNFCFLLWQLWALLVWKSLLSNWGGFRQGIQQWFFPKLEMWLPPGCFGLHIPLNQQTKKREGVLIYWMEWLILIPRENWVACHTVAGRTISGTQKIL